MIAQFSKKFYNFTYRMYMITPKDQISHDLSYFSGPNTSGAKKKKDIVKI